ncbi:hypothetical protein V8C86DRAFT_2456112, partial [Haematococcus lacustris]
LGWAGLGWAGLVWGLIAFLHCCLEDPWAGVGLVLILKTAKHLCRSTEAGAAMKAKPQWAASPILKQRKKRITSSSAVFVTV